jgi:GNAT superfamily N-acetyltransferase
MGKQLSDLTVNNQVLLATTPSDIASCFSVIVELRPKCTDKEEFVAQILRQQSQGYIFSFIKDEEEVGACMGFRILETLGWGKILYIDDLITREKSRKKGLGTLLLDYAIEQGRLEKCSEVHLDTGHHRHDAHRLYLNSGFTLTCHHLALTL